MCIIASASIDGHICLLKNRDRNYEPHLRVVHFEHNGVEILIFIDLVTGWLEGINSHGICIVNSALMVQRDEKEKKKGPKKSNDGKRILNALVEKTLHDATRTLLSYDGGIHGHTFITNGKQVVNIESTSKVASICKILDPKGIHVRTNHGIWHPGSGYQKGEGLKSSKLRKENAEECLKTCEKTEDMALCLHKHKYEKHSPYNMVRDTEQMRTTSQIVFSPDERKVYCFVMKDKCYFKGYKNMLPKGYNPKLSYQVKIL